MPPAACNRQVHWLSAEPLTPSSPAVLYLKRRGITFGPDSPLRSSWAGFLAGVTFTVFMLFGVPVIRAIAQGVHP